MRERLIELIQNFTQVCDKSCEGLAKSCYRCTIEQLAEYLLANGVIVPTSKVGEKIYIHQFDNKMKKVVVECEIIEHNEAEELFKVKLADGRILTLLFQFIGKTVFLSREEAEKALEGGDE